MSNNFDAITVKAWLEYQEAGLHATAAEVEIRLASWGTQDELPAPQCHTQKWTHLS